MYFVKARKSLEDQDARDLQEKTRRDRYQRSDSARLVVQAMPTAAQQPKQATEGKSQFHRSDSGAPGFSSEINLSDFRPEELPDGACYRPRKDLTNLASTSQPGSVTGESQSQSRDIRNSNTGLMEHVRAVEVDDVQAKRAGRLEAGRPGRVVGEMLVMIAHDPLHPAWGYLLHVGYTTYIMLHEFGSVLHL
ncbi:hypothetical protein ElyMa_002054900 [Elysia marginata]|uniref:Uncharacterized protein n=1 Tax=Elysia marginata TaxID=1093978 RepID=A0AAV4FA38_9GAST|nr:hypothetical protein ElyMa_002054900 [Elysia marginata]